MDMTPQELRVENDIMLSRREMEKISKSLAATGKSMVAQAENMRQYNTGGELDRAIMALSSEGRHYTRLADAIRKRWHAADRQAKGLPA